jgi:regulator of protease activity HflC (stomatin/prohibitin superfamily)
MENSIITLIAIVFGTVIYLTGLLCGPLYRVWKQRLRGQADYAQAEAETKITILRARAEYEAAHHLAEADVERAKGISTSIEIVEARLGGPEGYLRWKYIHMLEEGTCDNQIIYIPTEAGLPILEAGKRK